MLVLNKVVKWWNNDRECWCKNHIFELRFKKWIRTVCWSICLSDHPCIVGLQICLPWCVSTSAHSYYILWFIPNTRTLNCRFLSTLYLLEKWKILFCLKITNGIIFLTTRPWTCPDPGPGSEDPLSSKMADRFKKSHWKPNEYHKRRLPMKLNLPYTNSLTCSEEVYFEIYCTNQF